MKIFYTWLLVGSKCQSVWQSLVRLLTTSSELQVWQTHRGGDTAWHAYDPMTGRSACFGSEAEMRMWIEMQYYSR
ncbi:hypothetical protein Cylst_3333 [Cylindrospermum stagnale PCC 7417]|uniref:Uncharacterized protein n=1 Tax=Cylindrospermum stagnale PCC 7417 TaxID=56107 RepID=K9WYN8_9NOST|nr:hypothetical protein [Cylindrospermum stagnale]AFZ25485.1 hypothetical protein Cylst_3333 [Cylindrospermum stagnale PCC 7417]